MKLNRSSPSPSVVVLCNTSVVKWTGYNNASELQAKSRIRQMIEAFTDQADARASSPSDDPD
eukprot:616406-Hanusia_phi.AAC.1